MSENRRTSVENHRLTSDIVKTETDSETKIRKIGKFDNVALIGKSGEIQKDRPVTASCQPVAAFLDMPVGAGIVVSEIDSSSPLLLDLVGVAICRAVWPSAEFQSSRTEAACRTAKLIAHAQPF